LITWHVYNTLVKVIIHCIYICYCSNFFGFKNVFFRKIDHWRI